MKHLLSLEKLARSDMQRILADAVVFKKERNRHGKLPLAGQTWALIFNKSSTRTRVSVEVGIRELGGQAMFLSANDIQIGRGEPIKDTARVLGRMIHGAVIRTYAQSDVEEFAHYSGVPNVTLLYTDVWVSMGKEAEAAERIKALSGYQINRALVKLAKPNALIMHCLPAYRGKEIDEETFEANAQTIFDQAENRLHAQKSILNWLVS